MVGQCQELESSESNYGSEVLESIAIRIGLTSLVNCVPLVLGLWFAARRITRQTTALAKDAQIKGLAQYFCSLK
jgi:hypothetical protein